MALVPRIPFCGLGYYLLSVNAAMVRYLLQEFNKMLKTISELLEEYKNTLGYRSLGLSLQVQTHLRKFADFADKKITKAQQVKTTKTTKTRK